jgi:hypothetical protein
VESRCKRSIELTSDFSACTRRHACIMYSPSPKPPTAQEIKKPQKKKKKHINLKPNCKLMSLSLINCTCHINLWFLWYVYLTIFISSIYIYIWTHHYVRRLHSPLNVNSFFMYSRIVTKSPMLTTMHASYAFL